MNICDESDHGEIVYDDRNCPACARVEYLLQINADKGNRIKELESENEALDKELEEKTRSD